MRKGRKKSYAMFITVELQYCFKQLENQSIDFLGHFK